MKAITCTQCGATIDDVSERSLIVHCDYCGARLFVDRVAAPVTAPVEERSEFYEEQPAASLSTAKIVALVIAASVAIPLLIGVFALESPKTSGAVNANWYAPGPSTYPTPSSRSVSAEPAKPPPAVNYQPRVSWDGPSDMESFDEPEVDLSSVANLSSEEVKKTVFKNRTVKLRVVINTEGEIDTVETISGHPILVEAATVSAKRSIFRSRSKPATRILTYTFRVLED
jgi:DNA-directed RNA polymerase subunit RPC12/RpoP